MVMRDRSSFPFDELYKEHGKAVLALVWALGVSEGEREDVAQEVWLVASRAIDGYEERTARAWLATITRNVVLTWRRTRRRRPELSTRLEEGAELMDLETPEMATADQQRHHAVRAFVFAAIPDEERRDAFILHEVFGQTVAEVAETMKVPLVTAQTRLKMARRDIQRAKQALSEEEKTKLRAFIVPFASIDAMMDDLRSSVSDEEATRVGERVRERIAREGNGDEAPQDTPRDSSPEAQDPREAPSMDVPASPGLSGAVVGAFLAGVIVGAGALHAMLSRDKGPPASIVTFEAPAHIETTAERLPEPESTASAAPTARAAPTATSTADTGATWEADVLLGRARREVASAPRVALALVKEHAGKYPKKSPAKRQEIEIHALLQLGERDAAEACAAQLIGWEPSMRPAMEELFGQRFP